MQVGDRIRLARRRRGLTQDALARLVDSTSITISRYERGTISEPGSKNLQLLAEALEVTTDWLLTGAAPDPFGTDLPATGTDA